MDKKTIIQTRSLILTNKIFFAANKLDQTNNNLNKKFVSFKYNICITILDIQIDLLGRLAVREKSGKCEGILFLVREVFHILRINDISVK